MKDENRTVRIYDKNNPENFLGCGFFVDNNNIVTCKHNIEGIDKVIFKLYDFIGEAELIELKIEDKYDIAYLSASKSPYRQGYYIKNCYLQKDKINKGEKVYTYGYSSEQTERGVPTGIIYDGLAFEDNGIIYLSFSNAKGVTIGYSGAPVVTKSGKIIGMIKDMTKIDKNHRRDDQCFALPLEYILEHDNIDTHKKQRIAFVQEAVKTSSVYIKTRVASALFGTETIKDINIEEIISHFNNKEDNDHWLNLYNALVSVRRTIKDESGSKVNIPETGILCWIKDCIETSEYQNPITIRGSMKSGKSMFLSYCYLYLISEFVNGRFEYIPFYFNIEKYKRHAGVTSDFFNNSKTAFDNLLEVAGQIEANSKKKVVFLIDGLSEWKYYGTDEIEKYIITKTRARRSRLKDINDKYIFIIDSDNDIQVEKTCISEERNAEFLIYFDPIKKVKMNYDKDEGNVIENFIKNYCLTFVLNTNDHTLVENFSTLNLPYIDLHFLTQFGIKLANNNFSDSVSMLYKDYFMSIVAEKFHHIAPKIAFEMYYSSKLKLYKTFSKCIDVETFEILKNEKMLANYLVADYYVDNIRNYAQKKETDFHVLNHVFSKNVSIFIVDIIHNKGIDKMLLSVSIELYKALKNSGRAALSYLVGRINLSKQKILTVLNEQEQFLKDEKKDNNDSFRLAAERSLSVSKISIASTQDCIKYNKLFLIELIKNPEKRAANRSFHKLYYGDISLDEYEENNAEDVIKQGFDFYNTYHRLATRIQHDFIDEKIVYALLPIELFTLCNLVQVRLQQESVTVKNKKIPTFFFNVKYDSTKRLGVIKKIILYVDTYLKTDTTIEKKNPIKQYFMLTLNLLTVAEKKLEDDELTPFDPASIIQSIERIFQVEKTGWKLNDYQGIVSKETMKSLPDSQPLETTSEHVLSTYLIGLFFLPNNIDKYAYFSNEDRQSFDKQQILNLVLIHDLGESEVLDFPPHYEKIEDVLTSEDLYNRQLFLSGTYENFADLYNYYELWDAWSQNDNNINVRIAKELDRIQMLYKYYTLTLAGKLQSFTTLRKKNIMNESNNIKTSVGIKILKQLVTENPAFSKINGLD